MSKTIRIFIRIIITFSVYVFTLFLFWLSGCDFDRSKETAYSLVMSFLIAGIGFCISMLITSESGNELNQHFINEVEAINQEEIGKLKRQAYLGVGCE